MCGRTEGGRSGQFNLDSFCLNKKKSKKKKVLGKKKRSDEMEDIKVEENFKTEETKIKKIEKKSNQN